MTLSLKCINLSFHISQFEKTRSLEVQKAKNHTLKPPFWVQRPYCKFCVFVLHSCFRHIKLYICTKFGVSSTYPSLWNNKLNGQLYPDLGVCLDQWLIFQESCHSGMAPQFFHELQTQGYQKTQWCLASLGARWYLFWPGSWTINIILYYRKWEKG